MKTAIKDPEIDCPELSHPWCSAVGICGLSGRYCALETGDECDYLKELKLERTQDDTPTIRI